jgi:uncharacterized protein (TIGR03032 family)
VGFGWQPHAEDPRLHQHQVTGKWWETLGDLGITLLVTREYEHLLLSLHVDTDSGPFITMLGLPHPSGIAVDLPKGVVHVAATRNPNQIIDLMPVNDLQDRLVANAEEYFHRNVLIPVKSRIFPGSLYIHDLAMVNNQLHANAVGRNSIVRLSEPGRDKTVWWPKCVETAHGPILDKNHLQLNSIAAGQSLEKSYFSASTDEMTDMRPGDPAFPVDGRGVIFDGTTREPIARGLTRPHSARLHGNRIWVDNSGYGEVGFIESGKFVSTSLLSGWTRGLCFHEKVMFVGTSRVLPRFIGYAPGLDVRSAQCGIHAIDVNSGQTLGSITWPYGSQIFAVECVPALFSTGLPFHPGDNPDVSNRNSLFYSFQLKDFSEE